MFRIYRNGNKNVMFDKAKILERVIQDGVSFKKENNSYYVSYPEFVQYFQNLDFISKHNLIIGINFVYGWMPTILKFRSDEFEKSVNILNEAKESEILLEDKLNELMKLFNNSLVGTSKLLHFINPEKFAIWDSRVYRYLTGKEPYYDSIGKPEFYLEYLEVCNFIASQDRFENVYQSIVEKIGYKVSKFRAIELIMFTNGVSMSNPETQSQKP